MNTVKRQGKLIPFPLRRSDSHPAFFGESSAMAGQAIGQGSVLILDQDERRAEEIADAITSNPTPARIELYTEAARLMRNLHKSDPDVIIVSLAQFANEPWGGGIVSALRLLDFAGEIIVFDDATQAPRTLACGRFLAIAPSDFLDSAAPGFIEQLQQRVRHGLLRGLRYRRLEGETEGLKPPRSSKHLPEPPSKKFHQFRLVK